ncbi:MAG TPA: hypothetical protein VJB59_03800 [Bdellovibrionota bacterium]|nr:hypothetical protein [Bdellovibrionota bacterium]
MKKKLTLVILGLAVGLVPTIGAAFDPIDDAEVVCTNYAEEGSIAIDFDEGVVWAMPRLPDGKVADSYKMNTIRFERGRCPGCYLIETQGIKKFAGMPGYDISKQPIVRMEVKSKLSPTGKLSETTLNSTYFDLETGEVAPGWRNIRCEANEPI